MSPAPTYSALVERIKSLRASLNLASDPNTRSALLEELGTATQELATIIFEKEGRLTLEP